MWASLVLGDSIYVPLSMGMQERGWVVKVNPDVCVSTEEQWQRTRRKGK